MYVVLHELAETGRNIPAGFIHIPASHDLAAASKKELPSWSDRDLDLIEAVKIMIATL